MRLIVKDLKGKQFEIQVEQNHTVRQVKERIEEDHKVAADSQKLVAVGKVMDDAKEIDFYNVSFD